MKNKILVIVEPTSNNTEILEVIKNTDLHAFVLTPFENDIENIRNIIPNSTIQLFKSYDIDEWIKLLPNNSNIVGIFPGNELAVARTAKLAEHVRKGIYTNHKTALACRYKDIMRTLLEKKGDFNPRYKIVDDKQSALIAAEAIGYPCVVKPTDQAASYGVMLVNNSNELCSAIKNIYDLSLYEDTYGFENAIMPKRKEILVEEMLKGQEFSVESFSVSGKIVFCSVTEKETTKGPSFIEIGHSVPPLNNRKHQAKLIEFNKKTIEALGIKDGITHCEIMLTDNGMKLIECANRIPGDQISELHRLCYSVDLAEKAILHAVGEKVDFNTKTEIPTVIKFIFFHKPGIINKTLSNDKKIKSVKGVVKFKHNLTMGKKVNAINKFSDRHGYVICQGNTIEEAHKYCDNAISLLKKQVGFNQHV